MNKATREALEGSITKWEGILAGTETDRQCFNCPLCLLFPEYACHGCPIRRATGAHGCIDTPYMQWLHHHVEHKQYEVMECVPGCKTCLKLARAELKFLISLRPKPRKRSKR